MKKLLVALMIALQLIAFTSCTETEPARTSSATHEKLTYSIDEDTEAVDNEEMQADDEEQNKLECVINKNSKKVHKPWCHSAKRIKAKNYGTASYEWAISHGYTECKNCFK